MRQELAVSFKITNWCNLNCAHCCECSNCHNVPNFMPLEKIDNYVSELRYLPIIPNELICIGGGEAMAPYMYKNNDYIPRALDLIYSYKYIPTIKTNGTWGRNDKLRKKILSDISAKAYKHGKLVTLDISVDEFHNNLDGVAKIIRDIMLSSELCYAIRFCLVGFNTPASLKTLNRLQQKLQESGFYIHRTIANDWTIDTPNADGGIYVCNDYTSNIYNLGRAKQTKVYNCEYDATLMRTVDCFQIDNEDNAILNYLYREKINKRSLNMVFQSLVSKHNKEY